MAAIISMYNMHLNESVGSNDQSPLHFDDSIFYESMEEEDSTVSSASSSFSSSTPEPRQPSSSRRLSEIIKLSLPTLSAKDPWYQRHDSREPEKGIPTLVMQTVSFDEVSAADTSKNPSSKTTHEKEPRKSLTTLTTDAKETSSEPTHKKDLRRPRTTLTTDAKETIVVCTSRSYDSISSRLSCAGPDNKREEAETTSHTQVKIQVKSGVYMVLRSASETLYAVEKGFASCVTCTGCKGKLKCVPDAEMVICPDCRVASPMGTKEDKWRKSARGSTSSVARRGVGLGLMVKSRAAPSA